MTDSLKSELPTARLERSSFSFFNKKKKKAGAEDGNSYPNNYSKY